MTEITAMITFDNLLSTYIHDNRKAEVHRVGQSFGIRMYENNVWMKDEVIEKHSESYSENAAENYVFGIKN